MAVTKTPPVEQITVTYRDAGDGSEYTMTRWGFRRPAGEADVVVYDDLRYPSSYSPEEGWTLYRDRAAAEAAWAAAVTRAEGGVNFCF